MAKLRTRNGCLLKRIDPSLSPPSGSACSSLLTLKLSKASNRVSHIIQASIDATDVQLPILTHGRCDRSGDVDFDRRGGPSAVMAVSNERSSSGVQVLICFGEGYCCDIKLQLSHLSIMA